MEDSTTRLEKSAPAMEALHEAGHAVMARLLGLSLERVWINRPESSGGTCVIWHEKPDPREELRILAAARACLNSFGIHTFEEHGGFGDAVGIQNILADMFHDNESQKDVCLNCVDVEVAGLFERPDVRAAAWDLAEVLTCADEINGPQAESVIDQHLLPDRYQQRYQNRGMKATK